MKNLSMRICLIITLNASLCFSQIVNYDNDPDLKAAIGYDIELNGGDRVAGDRQKAVNHYLAYLERCKESYQRARVYYQLGVMHSTAFNRRKKEKPDYEIAKRYFALCLKEEPERLDRPTLFARTQSASLHTEQIDRVRANMEIYELLNSLDAATLQDRMLPDSPSFAVSDRKIAIKLRKFSALTGSTGTNMVVGAAACKDAELLLSSIINKFPNSEAAKLAETFRKKVVKKNIASIERIIFSDAMILTSKSISAKTAGSEDIKNNAVSPKVKAPTSNVPEQVSEEQQSNTYIIAAVFVVALIAVAFIVLLFRRKVHD